jgi:hypothetical protein
MRRFLRPNGLPGQVWTLRAFVWQPDLLMVVRYIYDSFHVRARILTPCVDVPSNQPHLAGLM